LYWSNDLKMKKISILIILLVYSTLGFTASKTPTNSNNIESFNQLFSQLESAVAARNFIEVREVLEALMPIMKEDIKLSKKMMSTVKKDGITQDKLNILTENYNKKNEIYETITHLMEVSSAALRVKATVIVAQTDSFRSMMEE
jgi:hypothetical protein